MSDLARFLLDRIAEDEAAALEAIQPTNMHPWGNQGLPVTTPDDMADELRGYLGGAWGEHAARWAVPRVLATCAADRRIIELHDHTDGQCFEMQRGVYGPGWPEGSYAVEGESWAHSSLESIDGPCETLKLLAEPYRSHPSFDASWLLP